jgi:hypothetical protein
MSICYKKEVFSEDSNYYQDFDFVGEFWVKYEGDFYNDKKHGRGTVYFFNNDIFFGTFVNDMADGDGNLQFNDRSVLMGIWKENKLIKIVN